MGSLDVAKGMQMPNDAILQQTNDIADRCRKLSMLVRQTKPDAMPFLVKAIENLAMLQSSLNGESPAAGLPSSPPGPTEPHIPTQPTASSAGTGFPAV